MIYVSLANNKVWLTVYHMVLDWREPFVRIWSASAVQACWGHKQVMPKHNLVS